MPSTQRVTVTKSHAPVQKELLIKASPAHAFRVFTEQMDQWWPRSHHIGKAEMKKAVLETREGGRWYEIGVDGSECNWGKVLRWNPPHKLVLAWQINSEWQYDPQLITEVEVNFIEKEPKLTRLTLEHRDIEKSQISRAIRRPTAWQAELPVESDSSVAPCLCGPL